MESPAQSLIMPAYRSDYRDDYLSFQNDLPVQPNQLSELKCILPQTLEPAWSEKPDERKGRIRNPEKWKQNVRKKYKNLGLEYKKANGEVSSKKELGPPCQCKDKCFLRIGVENCRKIFNNFWKLGDYSLQNAYIAGCVRIVLPKCHKEKEELKPSRKFFSRIFYVNCDGIDTEVCKQAFLNLHAVSNGRLDRLLKKKQESGNTGVDERGRHNNKVNKIPSEKITEVQKHIDKLREQAGFTGKRKSKHVELFTNPPNIRTMYKMYKDEMLARGMEPVCEYRYRKIFHDDYHIEFAKNAQPKVVQVKNCPLEGSNIKNDGECAINRNIEANFGTMATESYENYPLQGQNWNFTGQS